MDNHPAKLGPTNCRFALCSTTFRTHRRPDACAFSGDTLPQLKALEAHRTAELKTRAEGSSPKLDRHNLAKTQKESGALENYEDFLALKVEVNQETDL
jgi:hypothetical protein